MSFLCCKNIWKTFSHVGWREEKHMCCLSLMQYVDVTSAFNSAGNVKIQNGAFLFHVDTKFKI